jgi:hypothetical protein
MPEAKLWLSSNFKQQFTVILMLLRGIQHHAAKNELHAAQAAAVAAATAHLCCLEA